MGLLEDRMVTSLMERGKQGNLRKLTHSSSMIDFVSNDYLGLASNQTLFELIRLREEELLVDGIRNGAGGSRLLSGNTEYHEQVEKKLANLFQAEKALIFNSGYQANLALMSSVPQKGDTILYDQLSHICLKEGAWLSKAQSIMFGHNDLEDLERKLKLAEGQVFVVIETVYSMDGDIAPMQAITSLSKEYGAHLIVDEAHTTGVYGEAGNGMLNALNFTDEIFARVYTFGKGMGIHGACIAGSETLINYMINFARPFIYTTALPIHSMIAIEQSFEFLKRHQYLQENLKKKVDYFKMRAKEAFGWQFDEYFTESETAIQPVIIPGNDTIRQVASGLNEKNFDVRPVLSPTVKSGTERLRICLHTYNENQEIDQLLTYLAAELI